MAWHGRVEWSGVGGFFRGGLLGSVFFVFCFFLGLGGGGLVYFWFDLA